nr:hypothetical protein [Tanacetum cinerariifolium]
MSKTQANYGSGVTRPKINDKYHFELKGQFLKELRDNTFNGSDHEDANRHIEKVLKIVDLLHIPNITQDQIMLRAFLMSLTGATSLWLRNKPSGLIKTWEDLKVKFLCKYCPPAQNEKKMEEINNFHQELDETLYQEWERFKKTLNELPSTLFNGNAREYSQKWYNRTSRTRSTETSDGLAAIQAQLNNLGREIKNVNEKIYAAQELRDSTDTASRNQGALIKALEIQNGKMSKECEVVDKPMVEEAKDRNDNKMVSRIFRYPNDYDEDEKICIDYAKNLKFSFMLGFEFVHANFFPNFLINVRNFYVLTDFIVVEDMDPYLDDGIGEVVVGEPDCEVSCVETRRFDGIITIHDEDDSTDPYSCTFYRSHTSIPEIGLNGFPIFSIGSRWKEIDNADFRTWLGISIRDCNDEYYGFRWCNFFKLEPEKEEIIEPNAAKGDDQSKTVRTEEEVEEESKESNEESEEEDKDDP